MEDIMEFVTQTAVKTLIDEVCEEYGIEDKNADFVHEVMYEYFKRHEKDNKLQYFCKWLGCEFNAHDFAEMCFELIRE